MPSFPCGTIEIQGKGGIILYQIGEFIVKAANGVCEVKDLVHLDFSDTDSKRRACPAGQKSYGGGWALF